MSADVTDMTSDGGRDGQDVRVGLREEALTTERTEERRGRRGRRNVGRGRRVLLLTDEFKETGSRENFP